MPMSSHMPRESWRRPGDPGPLSAGGAFGEVRVPYREGRRAVEPEVLIAVINGELSRRPECAALSVGGRRWEAAEGPGGSNWSEASLVLRVAGSVPPAGFTSLRQVIAEARMRYDVIVPGSRREAA